MMMFDFQYPGVEFVMWSETAPQELEYYRRGSSQTACLKNNTRGDWRVVAEILAQFNVWLRATEQVSQGFWRRKTKTYVFERIVTIRGRGDRFGGRGFGTADECLLTLLQKAGDVCRDACV